MRMWTHQRIDRNQSLSFWIIIKWLGGGINPKNMFVKLDHFPRDRGENEKYLKPPPRWGLKSWTHPWSFCLCHIKGSTILLATCPDQKTKSDLPGWTFVFALLGKVPQASLDINRFTKPTLYRCFSMDPPRCSCVMTLKIEDKLGVSKNYTTLTDLYSKGKPSNCWDVILPRKILASE